MRKISDDELREIVANLAISQAKTDEQFGKSKAESDKRQAKLEKQMTNVLGFIGNSADILENNFATALEDSNMIIDNIQYDEMETNFKGRNKQLQGQYDIVLFNSSHLFIVEVKRKPHINDFKQILKQKESFPQIFNDYKDFNIHLGLAGETFYPEVIKEAQRLGIYILKTKAEELEIITP